ncbi:PAS-domain containing protein [Salinarimonas soli]|uniref:histidine kinase n=1 Tax=Salinarimonas soli TaxID=1638099 RepID=A0A5B2VGY9_9HYPH|nr:PAS domain-containing protein [Salinarimonas soli]
MDLDDVRSPWRDRPVTGAPAWGVRLRAALLAGVASVSGSGTAAAQAGILEAAGNLRFEAQHAVGVASVAGLVIFSTTLALLHLWERKGAAERERALRRELDALHGAQERAEMLVGAERQLMISWDGRDGEPRIDGDASVLGDSVSPGRPLAFGAWLSPADAAAIDAALARLKERGEGFHLTLRTTRDRFMEAEGRAIGGRAILRLRDVTGDRLELLRVRQELARAAEGLTLTNALLDALAQPVWLRDADGRLAWVNRAYLQAVEAASVEDVRARSLELLDRGARDEAEARRRTGERYEARVAAVVAGTRRVLDVAEGPAGSGSAGMAVDVSELDGVRADLQRQMEAHARTLDQVPTAVAIFDSRQRLVFHNTGYRQLWGLDQAFLDGHPTDGEILDHLRAGRKLPEQADFRAWKAAVLGAYRTVEPQETWWHLPDRRTLRVVATPGPGGGLTYLYDDVSDRILLESQYNALNRVQRETLDTLREGVAVFGSDGRLKLSNRAFADMWKLGDDTVASGPHIDAFVKMCRPLAPQEELWVDLRAAISGLSDMRLSHSCRMERRDGSVLDCTAQPLPDGATLLTFIDMTASVNVERALTEKNDALERASRLRDEFVHHVSYELRSPLTTIIGFAQLLGDESVGVLNARQREYSDHIKRSSGALLAIINDILDLASIDTGSLELDLSPVDIRETIESAVRGLDDRLADTRIHLDIQVPAGIGTFVADQKRVRQVLYNLLSNAIGFSSEGQTVTIRARKVEGEVLFEVTDQGRGMPPEVRAKVFERFESNTLGTRHRGVGLGLSIVRSFVELHGGRIDLASAPGQGTTVTCIFPADGVPQRLAAE